MTRERVRETLRWLPAEEIREKVLFAENSLPNIDTAIDVVSGINTRINTSSKERVLSMLRIKRLEAVVTVEEGRALLERGV